MTPPKPSKQKISREAQRHCQTGKSGLSFDGIKALLVAGGVSPRRLQIWKEKMANLGAHVVEPCEGMKKRFTHVLANDHKYLKQQNFTFPKSVFVLKFDWIEDCLKEGKVLPCDSYRLEEAIYPSETSCSEVLVKNVSRFGNTVPEIDQSSDKCKAFEQENEELCHSSKGLNVFKNTVDMEVSEMKGEFNPNACNGESSSYEEAPNEGDDVDASDLDSLNKHITSILREMWNLYECVLGDEWRSLTFRKASIRLEKLPYKILRVEDVKHVCGLGSSMIKTINEILCTGKLQKLENLKADAKVCTLQHLASVWGVGPKLAQKLYQAGHRRVEDLLKEPSLSQMARIGVKYHKDLAQRIPRDEVAAAEKYVQNIGGGLSPGIFISVAGSYRRGSPTCGDIDFLVTHPDGYSHQGFLSKLVEKLQSTGFISEGLHCTDNNSDQNIQTVGTFMGVGRVPDFQAFRRIDIKVYSKDTFAFALVYFTGNDVLNRKIRYAAQCKGFKLNDQGLYRRYGGKKGLSSVESIPCQTEQEVFEKVGFPYLEPCDRNL